ncbi:MAG: hypothetical protein JRJ82_19100 [Deltaproteobacteria bacterium]|nr:hypothetical protein [Deltaproteobacteria bacterium]MBW1901745.1 hypothetical protein [Deltaproteobacteria bacterium]
MTGKDYIIEAIGIAEKVSSECEASGKLEGNALLEKMAGACKDLGQIKNKPSLRTRDGADRAYPVLEMAQKLEEDWEDAMDGDDLGEADESMEAFAGAVEALINALKSKTVVMT